MTRKRAVTPERAALAQVAVRKDEVVRLVLEEGLEYTAAARRIGIPKRELSAWMASDPHFSLRLRRARLTPEGFLASDLTKDWRDAYLAALRSGATRNEALAALGKEPLDLEAAHKESDEFALRVRNEELRTRFDIEDNMLRRALESPAEAKFALQHLYKERYGSSPLIAIDARKQTVIEGGNHAWIDGEQIDAAREWLTSGRKLTAFPKDRELERRVSDG